LKRASVALGARMPSQLIGKACTVAGWLEMGWWMREQSCYPPRTLSDRNAIFDLVGTAVADIQVLYLEFGVYQGESIRYWSKLLTNPASLLHGFDSFEGLPESWAEDHPSGHFSTAGQIPEVSDSRVKFFKGWFEDTLPRYQLPAHSALVVNMDADLYSSTKFVLDHLAGWLGVGDWLYFDEFSCWQHEFRAFREFVEETGMRFEGVAESNNLWNIAFRRTA
jgi:Macrocin-O-methyltransferase (TylF)